jgi:heptosyltransferase-2
MKTSYAPDRILVICPNWIGDAVMATPALQAVRERFPNAHVALLAKPRISELLDGLPSFDEVIEMRGEKRLRGLVRLARSLRKAKCDLGLILTHSFRSALLARLAGIKRRVGYRGQCRGFLLTDGLQFPREGRRKRPRHMVEEYLDIAGHLGCNANDRSVKLAVVPEAAARAKGLLAPSAEEGNRPLVAIAPGASFGPSKLWYPDRWAAVADAIADRFGASIAILTAPSERELHEQIVSSMSTRPVPLRDIPLPLALLKGVVSQLDLLLCTDSGARHVAVALGVPTVVVMGPTDPRYSSGRTEIGVVMREDVDCSPCHEKVCPADHRCMKLITPEKVLEAASRLLEARGVCSC